jgi:hypothetical protein
MHRTKSCLPLVAGLAALMAFATPPALSAEPYTGGWKTGTLKLPAEPQTVTVTRTGGHGWFVAKDARGETVRVSLPPKFGWIERNGKLVPTESLRAGDQVTVWGLSRKGRFQAARARVVTDLQTAGRTTR